MPIAVFGSKVFEVTDSKIYTLGDLQYGTSLDTEKQDAEGKKPSTYNKGPTLNSFSITLKLNAQLGVNPRRELEEWEFIKDAGIAYPFMLGRSPLGLGSKWLLVDIQASNFVIDNEGNTLAIEVQLKFDEYVRPGSSSASGSNGSAKGQISVPGLAPVDYGVSVQYGPEDKSGYKRDNPEMARSAFDLFKG